MELDDLKQTWKQADSKQKPINKNIMELIQQKSYGPIAALKRSYQKQILVMFIIPFLLLLTNIDNITAALTSVMYWSYVSFCIGVITFAWFNYRIVDKMQSMDGVVKSTLEQQIQLLETRLKWKIIGLRIVLLVFIALTEILPYFQHYRMLNMWHSLPAITRFGCYAALLILQYFMSPFVLHKKFGRHLTYLKQLVKEMQ
jgi:hypothetical protein